MSYEASILMGARLPTDKLGLVWLNRRAHGRTLLNYVWVDYFADRVKMAAAGPKGPKGFVKSLPWGCIRDLIFGAHPLVSELGNAREVARFMIGEAEERWGLGGDALSVFQHVCEMVMADPLSSVPVEPCRFEWDASDDKRLVIE